MEYLIRMLHVPEIGTELQLVTEFLPKGLQTKSLKSLYTKPGMLFAMGIFLLMELKLLFFHFLWKLLQLI